MPKPTTTRTENGCKFTYPRESGCAPDYIEVTAHPDRSITVRVHMGRLIIRPDVSNQVNIALERF